MRTISETTFNEKLKQLKLLVFQFDNINRTRIFGFIIFLFGLRFLWGKRYRMVYLCFCMFFLLCVRN